MGFGQAGAKRCLRQFKFINWDGKARQAKKGCLFYRGGRECSLCNTAVLWNFIVILTGYCKQFYRIPCFTILLLFCLLCVYWDWQGQKCKLTLSSWLCPNFCLHSSLWYKQLYKLSQKNTSIATQSMYLDGVFLKSKYILFMHKRNFNPKVIYRLLLMKLFADIFQYFQSFQHVIVFYFLTDSEM